RRRVRRRGLGRVPRDRPPHPDHRALRRQRQRGPCHRARHAGPGHPRGPAGLGAGDPGAGRGGAHQPAPGERGRGGGGARRLRAIAMTSITTVTGVLPLMFGWGGGGALYKPLAAGVIGGSVTALLVTFFLLPTAYAWMERRKDAGKTQ